MSTPQEFFQKNGYVVIENLVSREIANMLYAYTITVVQSIDFKLMHSKNEYSEDWDGDFGDIQVAGTFKKYGDPLMDTLLVNCTTAIESATGLDLQPNYSYWRLYQKDNILEKHKDRDSCEVSVTMCLGYNNSNVDLSKYPNYNWPMFVESKDRPEGLPISLNPGDAIIYRGCDVEHWRDRFLGLHHSQVFLHYNDKSGELRELYDGRPMIGIPGKFKRL
jgi:hypothetical protein